MTVAAPARPLTETNALRMPLPAAPVRRVPALRARPIAVAAYPAGTPRWVTYDGRRQRVVSIHDQPALDPGLVPAAANARRLQVQLADGRLLTLLHDGGGWYQR